MQTARLLPLAALVIACSAEAPAPPSEAGVPDVVLLPSVCDALASLASEPPIPAIPAQKETLPAVAAFTAEEATDAVTLTGGGLEIVVTKAPFAIQVRRASDQKVLLSTASAASAASVASVADAQPGFAPLASNVSAGTWSQYLDTWWMYEGKNAAWLHAGSVIASCTQDDRVSFSVGAGSPSGSDSELVGAGSAASLNGSDSELVGTYHVVVGPFYDGSVRLAVAVAEADRDVNRLAITFNSPADEHYVGFGERFNRVDQRGITVRNFSEEGGINPGSRKEVMAPDEPDEYQWPGGQTTSYAPVPFFISNHGYGLLADVPHPNEFDLAETNENLWRFTAESKQLALIVFDGPTPAEVLKRYTDRTGRSQVPRPWVFAPWNMFVGYSQGGTVGVARLFREQDIPVSVTHSWTDILPTGSHRGNPEGLKNTNNELHDLGFKHLCYIQPRVDQDRYPELWHDGAEKDVFMRTADGEPYLTRLVLNAMGTTAFMVSLVDFTSDGVEPWWRAILQEPLDLGYDGMMYDFGEYTPPDAHFQDGHDGLYWHNPYPLSYQRIAHRFFMELDDDPDDGLAPDYVWFHRSGYAGSQHWTWAMWGGDPEADWSVSDGLPASVTAGINNGLSGMPFWGSDIGGFHAIFVPAPTSELHKRWVQFGAFSGLMRDITADQISGGSRIHVLDEPELTAIVRRYQKLRTQLVPYITASAWQAHETGMPIMRAPLLMRPDDPKTWEQRREFFFGDDFYVAPVVEEGATERTLYLPEGKWVELWRSTEYESSVGQTNSGGFRLGGKPIDGAVTLTVSAPIDEIPVFVRWGAAIPLVDPQVDTFAPVMAAPPDGSNLDTADAFMHRLHVWVLPDGPATATLADGSKLDVQVEELTPTTGAVTLTRSITGDDRAVIAQVIWPPGWEPPASINGLTHVADADPLTLAPGTWTWSAARNAVAIHTLPGQGALRAESGS